MYKYRFFGKISLFFKEFIHILKVWIFYLFFKYLHKQSSDTEKFYKFIKANNNLKKICFNKNYVLSTKYYKHYKSGLLKFVKVPYSYFQPFSDKLNNKKIGNPNQSTKIKKILPSTYYEGIEFNNFVFDSFEITNIYFHNCSFVNCKFDKLTSKKSMDVIECNYSQGFSYCDFKDCIFESCKFESLIFRFGKMKNIMFQNNILYDCMLSKMSFQNVIFSNENTLNKTIISEPSGYFELNIKGSISDFHVDAQSFVTAFNYYDRANFTLEEWMNRRKYRSALTIQAYKNVASTYYILEQIWNANYILKQDNTYIDFYYQRKKAETRSKKGISKIKGYLFEWIVGYGEKPFRALISILIIIVLFSIIYMITGFYPQNGQERVVQYNINYFVNASWNTIFMDFLQSLYYSFFTMITVGQGSATPATLISQIIMMCELLMGSILMTLFTSTLFGKYTK